MNGSTKRFFPVLFRVAYHISGDRSAAEDLCQEAFIRYFNRTSPLRTMNDAKYWLIRVVKNLSYNYQKRKGREQNAYTKFYNEPKRELPDGETELLREETSQLVRAALEKLPPKLRSPIILKEYGGLSYKEIGKILRITEANVKVRRLSRPGAAAANPGSGGDTCVLIERFSPPTVTMSSIRSQANRLLPIS